MNFNHMMPLKLLVVFFIILNPCGCSSSSSANFPIAKPSCLDHCGNVSIPFPFGIGENCYYRDQNSNFAVECNTSKLKFQDSPFEITEISLEGQFRTMNYVGYNCYAHNRSIKSNSPWTSLGMPFIFNSTSNKFTVIGCDSIAIVQGASNLREYTTGCVSLCNFKEDVEDGSCSGIGCCQTSIPSGAWQINVSLSSVFNHSSVLSFNPCSYAFVVEEDAFHFYADNLTNLESVETLPVLVDWVISYKNCNEAITNKSSYACGLNSECYVEEGALGYRCRCNEGYEGNPYLGCQDIDECRNPDRCGKYSACTNTVGSYKCNCIKGYHEDGDGRCVANNKKDNWPVFIGVGLSGGTLCVLILSFCFFSKRQRQKEKKLREELFRKNGGKFLQEKLDAAKRGGTNNIRIYKEEELEKATNDFDESQIIGRGGFGTVYRGELTDHKVVAIKKSKGVDEDQVEQFINEVMLLSQINSRYVVKLLGCCLETEVPLLVYEYIDNGTLFDHLHKKFKSSLSWDIRLQIASEIAGVLSYLHSVASPPIIHRDIKSSNVLLDQDYIAKVSDFGISRLISSDDDQVATMVQGTLGYLDPEYMLTGLLTEKSDVYSFGIVLMEIITGKKVLSSGKPEAEKFLSNVFLASLEENHLAEILDNNISSPENIDQLHEVAMIAKRCISVRGEERPCMKDVERDLLILRAKAKVISLQVFEKDSTKSETLLDMHSIGYGSSDYFTSSGQYSAPYTTTEQPLLTLPSGR
ncbi:OLC1v1015650C1 [Oldenlandia corymbosa var. corymbosa]|uniref:OLC1v1015650C1 n=1 Tax=Oldenlandia corymbosa var. corymbosa TaxID=529605 RepID=A0AAV1E610_OLDCO|nr:OLC1v1015650C1 [Oldenlandia corymbosa var. corymbosa]